VVINIPLTQGLVPPLTPPPGTPPVVPCGSGFAAAWTARKARMVKRASMTVREKRLGSCMFVMISIGADVD
jgi:hypothetical protein